MKTKTNREEVKAIFATARSLTIHRYAGDEIMIYSPSCEAEVIETAEAVVKRGGAYTKDGVRHWQRHDARFDPSLGAPAGYTWDKAGDRVLHDTIRVARDDKTGKLTDTKIGTSWRKI